MYSWIVSPIATLKQESFLFIQLIVSGVIHTIGNDARKRIRFIIEIDDGRLYRKVKYSGGKEKIRIATD